MLLGIHEDFLMGGKLSRMYLVFTHLTIFFLVWTEWHAVSVQLCMPVQDAVRGQFSAWFVWSLKKFYVTYVTNFIIYSWWAEQTDWMYDVLLVFVFTTVAHSMLQSVDSVRQHFVCSMSKIHCMHNIILNTSDRS